MRCEVEALRVAPYCVLGDQIVAVRPLLLKRRLRASTRNGKRSAGTVVAATARQRSWGLLLAKTAGYCLLHEMAGELTWIATGAATCTRTSRSVFLVPC